MKKGFIVSGVLILFMVCLSIYLIFTDKVQPREDLVYQEGETVNLNISNFLEENTDPEVLKKAVLYSPLLDSNKYDLDDSLNVTTKGKDYLEAGQYYVYIVYQGEEEKVNFEVKR